MNERYEIQIKGHLDSDWYEWFSGFAFAHQPDGTTLLQGQVNDQPALHGLLMRINQLGLPLLRVERINSQVDDDE
jgi:hypothetical protein